MIDQGTYNNLLTTLQTVQAEDQVDIKIPTQSTTGTFKRLTVNQQKKILRSAVDMKLPELKFLLEVNNILTSNLVTECELYVTDRVPVMLQLRAATLGPSLKISTDSEPVTIDLNTHLTKTKRSKLPVKLFKKTISSGSFKVDCEVPTLDLDTKISQDCITAISGKLKTEEDLAESVGEVFVYEVVKYIQSIKFSDTEDKDHTINFTQLNTRQRISVFEKLPMAISALISKYITDVKDFENKFLAVPATREDAETINIDFSPSLFSVE